MKKSTLAMMMAAGMSLRARATNVARLTAAELAMVPHHSRGKGGTTTGGRSNAAAFKRAAKKRNNIRKHK